jgi:hypothetical protein
MGNAPEEHSKEADNMNYLEELKRLSQEDMVDRYLTTQSAYLSPVELLRGCQRDLLAELVIETGKIRLQASNSTIYFLRIRLMPALLNVFQLLGSSNTQASVFAECEKMFRKKNTDYGNAFVDFGAVGVLIRINDKLNRAITLQLTKNKQQVDNETLTDTLLDAVNYTIMADILLGE